MPLQFLSPTFPGIQYSPQLRGCTSDATIPALLHATSEARAIAQEHYRLSFNLAGGYLPKIWFSPNDILYFGPQSGYLATHKNFTNTISLLAPSEFQRVRSLAVHEDLFHQIRKESSPFEWNVNAGRSKDAWTERCLREFWEIVRARFWAVREIVIVSAGMEEEVVRAIDDMEEDNISILNCNSRNRMCQKTMEPLQSKIARVVGKLEADEDWVAPRWKVLEFKGHVRYRESLGVRRVQKAIRRRVRAGSRGEIYAEKLSYVMNDEMSLDVTTI